MDLNFQGGCKLLETIERGQFYDLSETQLLLQIKETFPAELERLKNAYAVERGSSPEIGSLDEDPQPTPSEILYGKNYDEINRTLIGVLSLRWLHSNDYKQFTTGQAVKVRLTRVSFDWLREFFDQHLKCSDDLFALVLSMIVNDLGKDPNLEEDYYHATMKTLTGQNHDAILLEAAKAGLVPCLDLLNKRQRADIMLGLELGSELNAGQLAQAENVPINLEGLLDMKGHEHAFHLKFMEQVLDVAGAAGHCDARGAKNFIEPVYQAFKTVYEVAIEIIAGNCTLREGYDKVLTERGDLLVMKGFRRLNVQNREERALLRLLTMGRTATREQADLFSSAFDDLDEENREHIVTGLNIDGMPNETAVLPYYMPAMLSESLQNTKSLPLLEKRRALTSLMRYLARVLASTDTHPLQSDWLERVQLQNGPGWDEGRATPGIVIERNMMKARQTISSAEFRENPNVLDVLEIPTGQVLQRRRTSHSF